MPPPAAAGGRIGVASRRAQHSRRAAARRAATPRPPAPLQVCRLVSGDAPLNFDLRHADWDGHGGWSDLFEVPAAAWRGWGAAATMPFFVRGVANIGFCAATQDFHYNVRAAVFRRAPAAPADHSSSASPGRSPRGQPGLRSAARRAPVCRPPAAAPPPARVPQAPTWHLTPRDPMRHPPQVAYYGFENDGSHVVSLREANEENKASGCYLNLKTSSDEDLQPGDEGLQPADTTCSSCCRLRSTVHIAITTMCVLCMH